METPSKRVQRQLTVADIKGASPMEAEAETLLLQSLEDKESKPNASAAILPNVPIEGMASFEGEPVEPPPPDVGADVKEKTFHEVADAGSGLQHVNERENLAALQMPCVSFTKRILLMRCNMFRQTDTDSFLNHADVLFRQSQCWERRRKPSRQMEKRQSLPLQRTMM